jgi:Condensation domain
VCSGLRKVQRLCGAGLFEIVAAAKIAALSYMTGSEDIVLRALTSGRDQPILNDLIALTADRVAFRVPVSMSMTFADLISMVSTTFHKARIYNLPHGCVEPILSDIGASNVFAFINFIESSVPSTDPRHVDDRLAPFDIPPPPPSMRPARSIEPHAMTIFAEQMLIVRFMYSPFLYRRETIDRFLEVFRRGLEQCAHDHTQRVADSLMN